jgi:hypothetical protein
MQQYQATHNIEINNTSVVIDGNIIFSFEESESDTLTSLYRSKGYAYPKFFKMDRMSKLGFLAAELLMEVVSPNYDKNKTAVIITTSDGSQDVDERFEITKNEIPSPALFVYTLPNIAVGEICIRHGFKGEQMVWIAEAENQAVNDTYIEALFADGNTATCLTGFLNANENKINCQLKWLSAL